MFFISLSDSGDYSSSQKSREVFNLSSKIDAQNGLNIIKPFQNTFDYIIQRQQLF